MSSKLTPLGEISPIDPEADQRILAELAEPVIPLVNRHINPRRFKNPETKHEFPTVTDYMGDNADMWTPAMLVPWTLGENFPADYVWTPEESPLPEAARSALILGLLTEDNLPWYSEAIVRRFGSNEAMRFFANVWTAEEKRHSDVMLGYMVVGRLVDPIQIERDRMANVITAQVPDPPSAIESLIYVTYQELATRVSHQNTGKLIADTVQADNLLVKLNTDKTGLANLEPVAIQRLDPEERTAYIRQIARSIMNRVAGDENKHFAFYRDATAAALEIDPSTVVKANELQIRGFQMPGTGIRDFEEHSELVAEAGVYDPILYHKLLTQVMGQWKIESLVGLDDEAETARERTLAYVARLGRIAGRFEEMREARRAAFADDPAAIWVGKTAA